MLLQCTYSMTVNGCDCGNREELFTYSIDWAAVDANDIVQTVMRPWIVKKIIEYLGN